MMVMDGMVPEHLAPETALTDYEFAAANRRVACDDWMPFAALAGNSTAGSCLWLRGPVRRRFDGAATFRCLNGTNGGTASAR